MSTITATAAGKTFTRNSKVAWTFANITTYDNGYVHCNWAKSFEAADKLASYRRAEIEIGEGGIVATEVVATTIS
jgi:hypothetical protein